MEKSLIIANNVRKFSRYFPSNCRRIYAGEVRGILRSEMRGDKKPRCTLVQLAFALFSFFENQPNAHAFQRRNFNPDLTLLILFAELFVKKRAVADARAQNTRIEFKYIIKWHSQNMQS